MGGQGTKITIASPSPTHLKRRSLSKEREGEIL